MRAFYAIVITGILIVLGMLFFPTVNYVSGLVDTTGWLPLTKAGLALMPYVFLGFVAWGIYQLKKR